MSDPDHARLRRLFDAAFALAPQARGELLDRECGADVALRRRILAMLEAAEGDRFLGAATLAGGTGPQVPDGGEGPGDRIGPYKLLQQIGEGGFGVVFLAEQEAPVLRRVALKIVKLGMDTRQVVARFEQERQALALMDHPNIARVFDAGATATGRPYFVMELVKGEPIVTFCDRHQMTIDARLELFAQVCSAVQHAHGKGVIHRDLKPSNILVGAGDTGPLVKIIDFGIAKATSQKLTDKTLFTEHRQVIGTMQYMSPEQAAGSLDIDTRTDVYALGVVLYELLTGTTPFDTKAFGAAILGELQRLIRDTDPPKPSTRLAQATDTIARIAALRRVAPKRLGTLVRGDIDWIVMKALEKDRGRRYQTATGLAEDVRRFLHGEAVLAVPPGNVYRLRKFVRRNKGPVAAVAAVVVALLLGAIAFAYEAKFATGEAARADREAALAKQRTDDVLSLSAIQELQELQARAEALWPVQPAILAACDEWLADAKVLVDGRPADPARGLAAHPGRRQHAAKLAEIRTRALPRTEASIAADRAANPLLGPWQADRARLGWLRRMLGDDPWPTEAEVQATLARETLPKDAVALRQRALALIDTNPATVVYGREIEGLLLARQALAAASDGERAIGHHTLARALFRTGRFDAAIAEGELAVAATAPALRTDQEKRLALLRQGIAEWTDAERQKRVAEAAELARRTAELEPGVTAWRTYTFADASDRWWHAQLERLIADLDAFADAQTGLFSAGISPAHGWGVVKRRDFAAAIVERSLDGADARQRWTAALAAIAASPRYPGLHLAPQLGLLPIGPDPTTGLWEFAHLQTGEPAVRGADGKLVLRDGTGLVFVLLPGGTFAMGAQRSDPNGANHDPQAQPPEAPVHTVSLSPFFLAKYEMTQAQWLRCTGGNPSHYKPGKRVQWVKSLLHPVEHVSWLDCQRELQRLDLTLPSEAQWEYGARGGQPTVWWTGNDRQSLLGAVNLADQAAARSGSPWPEVADWPELDDGFEVHAPVDAHRSNGFGLHGVHGNVWEWCLDGFDTGFYRQSPARDPVCPPSSSATRVNLGGCYANAAVLARSANRGSDAPNLVDRYLGVRPSRAVMPPQPTGR
ncbi:MAG: SUMF1/EgtB/PvdO family nonheme iron enzyme [Planctomycetes bacterium]|nr:SUMF1/EgtB/PvdO family nonheme iron enzyme [Planctomycetota bacterium]